MYSTEDPRYVYQAVLYILQYACGVSQMFITQQINLFGNRSARLYKIRSHFDINLCITYVVRQQVLKIYNRAEGNRASLKTKCLLFQKGASLWGPVTHSIRATALESTGKRCGSPDYNEFLINKID